MWEKIKAYFKRKQTERQAKKDRIAAVRPKLDQFNPPLTRKEWRLTGRGKYEFDAQTRKLTQFGLTVRLEHRLNLMMLVLLALVVVTYIVMLFF